MTEIMWLYSGIVSGWWCYDKKSCTELNKMYVDYCKKKGIDYSNFIVVDKKNNYDTTSDLVDFVDFSDFDDPVDLHDQSNLIKSDTIQSNIKNKTNITNTTNTINTINGPTNIIRTNHGDYIIDFNKMIQKNMHDSSKKRNIKYILIPEEINKNELLVKKYLLEKSIKGMSGIKF